MTDDKLPALPPCVLSCSPDGHYTADQMRQYALDAIAAARGGDIPITVQQFVATANERDRYKADTAELLALLREARKWIATDVVPLTTLDRIDAALAKHGGGDAVG